MRSLQQTDPISVEATESPCTNRSGDGRSREKNEAEAEAGGDLERTAWYRWDPDASPGRGCGTCWDGSSITVAWYISNIWRLPL
ncbi:hypothetical protein SETIT_2G280500v2 [Setaria italica]|uniref:Uncharacterized protein n=1 Tax=Setaria italica TaxID=4555 RepID=A0A368Q5Q3_SETIT|nr:hypothetical protein SETIT_2G280500v2 [Setaria italica]